MEKTVDTAGTPEGYRQCMDFVDGFLQSFSDCIFFYIPKESFGSFLNPSPETILPIHKTHLRFRNSQSTISAQRSAT